MHELMSPSTHVGRKTDRDDYETPPDLFGPAHAFYQFDVDCAASAELAKLPDFYSIERSFLAATPMEFVDKMCWLNPPFTMKEEFLKQVVRLRNIARGFVCLVPNNARECDWWRELVWPMADEIISLTPRVNYLLDGKPLKNGVPFSSCLVVYRPRLDAQYGTPRETIWRWKK